MHLLIPTCEAWLDQHPMPHGLQNICICASISLVTNVRTSFVKYKVSVDLIITAFLPLSLCLLTNKYALLSTHTWTLQLFVYVYTTYSSLSNAEIADAKKSDSQLLG